MQVSVEDFNAFVQRVRRYIPMTTIDRLVHRSLVRSVNAQIEVDWGRGSLEDDLRVPAEPSPNRKDEIEHEAPIISPADGYVIEKIATVGNTVEPGIPALTFCHP